MDKDEEEGVRAFAVNVGAHAGSSYPERPLWVEQEGLRVEVEAVEAHWREVERIGFRVRLTDGACLLLYYVPEIDVWSGVPYRSDKMAHIVRRKPIQEPRDA